MLVAKLDTCLNLTLGSPRFSDSHVSRIAITQGLEAAWRQALSGDPARGLNQVQGAFAVGLQEVGGARSLLAVDRFAIQTLCYRVCGDQIRFAARADALADADTPVDPQAIFDYLYFHAIPSPRTIYKGIFRLPPGHFALFSNGRLTVIPYWRPVFEEPHSVSFGALKEEFRRLLNEAVKHRLDGTKAACFLSGGTDSSTIAGLVGQMSEGHASSYSIGFDAEGYDEMEYARIAAKHFGTRHHEYYVTPDDLVRSIPAVAAHFDQPFGNSSVLPSYYCSKMAAEDGVTRILAGDGGDELFGGNTRYAKQRVFGWYGRTPNVVRTALIQPLLGTQAARAFVLTRKAGSYVEQARVPMPDRLQMYNLIMRLGLADVLTQDLLLQVDTSFPLQLQREVWRSVQGCSHLNSELAFDWRFTLAESDLPKVIGAAGLADIAVSFPMLDDRLVDFSLRLPTNFKLKGLQLRWFFKEALRGFLPDEILSKKKHGFGLPFGAWAIKHPALNAFAADSLHALVRRGVVRADFVQTLLKQHLPEHPGYFGEMVWILMMLEQWLAAKAPGFTLRA